MASTFVLVHASNNMFARTKARHKTINFLDNGDIYTTGENQKDKAYLRARPGFNEYVQGELAIGWRASRFVKIGSWHDTVMAGGRRGAKGSRGDARRRGPSRMVAMVALQDRETGDVVIIATHHAIAKADTSARWRRPLRDDGFRGVVNAINFFSAKHPGAAVILTGDLNTRGRITIFRGAKMIEVVTPATFGRLRYDRIYRRGCAVTNVKTRRTGTDHKALVAHVHVPTNSKVAA